MSLFFEILIIVLPVFVVISLGYGLKRTGLINADFLFQTNRIVYYIALPLLIFHSISTADFFANFNGRLIVGSALAIVVGFALSYGWGALRRYPAELRGTFSQGAFRGNLAYVGLAIIMNAYGEDGFTRAGILMGFLVPILNFFAIVALVLPHRDGGEGTGWSFWLKQIFLNPLIVASFAGIAWSFFAVPMPVILDGSLDIATGMALPLALLAIGGSFSLEKLKGDLVKAAMATGFKLIWLPLICAAILAAMGVRGIDLGIGVLFAATPAATANYIMAHQMKGDSTLAGSIIMMSTLASALTYTAALLLLRMAGA
ncbi:AEC family transporter [Geoalkalibacter halelectricus]|uniref:AEC family transporter n=1 Tax=Geoalkalibacter halelectricus TaxID=2847045 RepID=UPI003D2106A5